MAVQAVDDRGEDLRQVFCQDGLEKIVRSTVLEGAAYIVKIIITAENDELYRMQLLAQGMDQGYPVHALHFYVCKYNLRFIGLTEQESFFAGKAGADLTDIGSGQL